MDPAVERFSWTPKIPAPSIKLRLSGKNPITTSYDGGPIFIHSKEKAARGVSGRCARRES